MDIGSLAVGLAVLFGPSVPGTEAAKEVPSIVTKAPTYTYDDGTTKLIAPITITKPNCKLAIVVINEDTNVTDCNLVKGTNKLVIKLRWRPNVDLAKAACDSGEFREAPNGLDQYCFDVDF